MPATRNGSIPDFEPYERLARLETRTDAHGERHDKTEKRVDGIELATNSLVARFEKLLGRLEMLIWIVGIVGTGVSGLWWLFTHLK